MNIAAHYTEIRNKNRLTRLINLFFDNTHICYRAMEISYSSLVFWSTSFLSGIYSAHDRNASVYYVNVRQLLAYMIYEPVAQFSLVIHYTQFYYIPCKLDTNGARMCYIASNYRCIAVNTHNLSTIPFAGYCRITVNHCHVEFIWVNLWIYLRSL